MAKKEHHDPVEAGAHAYQEWRDKQLTDPAFRAIYEEEAAKSELWLQLVEARQKAGLTQQQMAQRLGVSQAQVARIEKRGYDAYTLTTLRRYITALGEGFFLEVKIHIPDDKAGEKSAEDMPRPHQFV
ncbi:MAG: XRE family transcriptional regulator [Chloroflexota bacterium]